jgi:hypothetical protein
MDLTETGLGVVDWIGLAQNRAKWRALVIAVMSLRVPQNTGELWNGYTSGGPPNNALLPSVS